MKRCASFSITMIWVLVGWNMHVARALTSTDALPRGVRAAAFVYGFAPTVDSTFDADGKLDYLVSPLNRSVTFNELAEFEPDLKRLKNVVDSIYPEAIGNQLLQADLYADASIFEQRFVSALLWGVTDRFSIGTIAPITKRQIRSSFDARVMNQGARLQKLVGNIPALRNAADQLAAAHIDTALFAQKIFTAHGYQTPGNFQKVGLGDIEIEGRFLALKTEMYNIGLRANLKIPTADANANLNNLLDRPFGNGSYAFKVGFLQDFKPLGPRWTLSSAVFLTHNFMGQQIMAVRRTPDQLLPDLNDPYQIETLQKKRGLDFSTDVAVSRSFINGSVGLALSYIYSYHGEDQFMGQRSLDYASLSKDTETNEHGLEISLEFSSIQMFLDETFPMPGKMVFAWYEPLKGRNSLYAPYGRMDFALLF